MRATVAALLLLLHIQPLAGTVLCLGLSGVGAEYMEAGCPMPGESAEAPVPDKNAGQSELGAPADPHECVFAEACNLTPTIARSLEPGVSNIPSLTDRAPWSPTPLLLSYGSAPPTPPPRA